MPTKIIRSLHNIRPKHLHAVMTIGNFDGVHIGHQQLLMQVVAEAKTRHVPSLVMIFEPHPAEFFNQQGDAVPRLTRLREKVALLAETDVDYILIIPFNQSFANITASDFVSKIIAKTLQPAHVMIGDDFRFGAKRQGDFATLQTMGKQLGFTVVAMPTVLINGERVSSTRVRQALAAGDFATAQQLLGRPFILMGRIRRGDQRGRQLGFPTANIFLQRKSTPVKGVFTVYMHGLTAHEPDKGWPGVANVGVRPTVDGTRSLLEVHLLDFNEDIYGRQVQVEFCHKLRDEQRYPSLELLKEQIAKDVVEARKYFQM